MMASLVGNTAARSLAFRYFGHSVIARFLAQLLAPGALGRDHHNILEKKFREKPELLFSELQSLGDLLKLSSELIGTLSDVLSFLQSTFQRFQPLGFRTLMIFRRSPNFRVRFVFDDIFQSVTIFEARMLLP
jgi:hypothetical protein